MLKIPTKFLLPLLMIFSLPIISHAVDENKLNCADAQTQYAMNKCAYLDYLVADKDLNEMYKRARDAMLELNEVLPGDALPAEKSLLFAQRAWLRYRDLACENEGYMFYGGTMASLIVSTCLERLTRRRIADLQGLVDIN